MKKIFVAMMVALGVAAGMSAVCAEELDLTPDRVHTVCKSERIDVFVKETPVFGGFTAAHPKKPYIDIFATIEGRNVLRDAPFDHLHHHGLMFAIKVNEVNFWEEFDESFGRQVVDYATVRSNSHTEKSVEGEWSMNSTIEFSLNWLAPDDTVLLRENRSMTMTRIKSVAANPPMTGAALFWTSELTNPSDKPVTLGGNHYHGLGMRFDESMDKGGRFFCSEGEVSPTGNIRGDESLTPCQWMAYTAKLNGHPVTVAVVDHPGNPRPMTAFTMGTNGGPFAYLSATTGLAAEPIELPPGQSVTFAYTVTLWDGCFTVPH